MKKLICILSAVFLSLTFSGANAHAKNYNMVFVPASEKGDENDYTSLIKIVNKLTGFKIKFIKVTDYNAAVEAMRADRAQIAWYGGKTYIKAAELANAEAFAAGLRPGEKDAGYFTYFVVKTGSKLKIMVSFVKQIANEWEAKRFQNFWTNKVDQVLIRD